MLRHSAKAIHLLGMTKLRKDNIGWLKNKDREESGKIMKQKNQLIVHDGTIRNNCKTASISKQQYGKMKGIANYNSDSQKPCIQPKITAEITT